MLKKYAENAYRKALLAALGATRVIYRADISLPSRWQGLLDALQVSSGFAYSALSTLDEDVDREVQEWETRFERSFGNEKYYSEEELKRISEEFSKIDIE
ncbi:MAG: hypothetical protein ABEJ87_01260 [Candidatus Nanohalobium sp.]